MMKRLLALLLLAVTLQGCEQSLKEDVKDVGQDIKNSVNKATD